MDKRINKRRCMHTHMQKEILPYAIIKMRLGDIRLSKISHSQNDNYYMVLVRNL